MKCKRGFGRRTCAILAAAVFVLSALASASPAKAAPTTAVKVGKAVPFAFAFIPMEVGKVAGIWAKFGVDPTSIGLGGDAKLQQALAAGSVDFGLGGGPAMAFAVKGVPAKAVAVFYRAPASISVIIPYNSPIKAVADLKGKRLGVGSPGSLTDWLAKRISVAEGWGPTGIVTVPLGGLEPNLAAMKTHQIDGFVLATEIGYALRLKHQGKILVNTTQFVKHFITHVIFARDALIEHNPELVQRFVDGFFATVAYMKAHKQQTVAIAARVLHQPPEVMARAYDVEMPQYSENGVFSVRAVAALKTSLVQMGMLKTQPSNSEMFTTRFVPARF